MSSLFTIPNLFVIVASLLSGMIVAYSIPKLMLLSLQKRLIDKADSRKSHTKLASRLGGISFYPAIFLSVSLCISFAGLYSEKLWQEMISVRFLFECCAIFIIYIVGVADDILGVKYKRKFIFQIITASLIVISGTWIKDLHGFCGIDEIPDYIGYLLTILLFVFITNSINLIDGIDGLASLLSMIALLVYGALFIYLSSYTDSLVAFATLGALLSFFYYNIFNIRKRSKSKIFMGDSGSLVIGFIVAILAIKLWNTSSFSYDGDENLAYMLAYTMLIVPCFDTLRVVLHRIKTKQRLFLPDRNHIHHKFMNMGFTQRQTLLIITSIVLFFLILNISLIHILDINIIVIIDVLIWSTLHIILTKKIKGKR